MHLKSNKDDILLSEPSWNSGSDFLTMRFKSKNKADTWRKANQKMKIDIVIELLSWPAMKLSYSGGLVM